MLRRFVNRLLDVPDWLYGRRAAGLDLGPGLLALGWAALMVGKPQLFEQGAFVGMSWLPGAVWEGLLLAMVALHAGGLLWPGFRALRVGASLVSAWTWIFVTLSLLRVEVTTGVVAYAIFGCAAFFSALHLAGQPRERR